MPFSPAIFGLIAFVYLLPIVSATRTVYRAEDITPITLYGPTAVYLPQKCPKTIEFSGRARFLPDLAKDKIGIFPRDVIVDGQRCKADALMLDFAPIGKTDHYPPQWVFEDSRFHGHPVNMTCGDASVSIRFGYFNDVSTKDTNGLLRPEVVYLDFAVIPNTKPFSFCSYAGRRKDGKRPLDFAPFPSQMTWKKFHELRKRTQSTPSQTNALASPMPEESMEAEADDDEEEEMPEEMPEEMDDTHMGGNNMMPTMPPGIDRIAHAEDPVRSL